MIISPFSAFALEMPHIDVHSKTGEVTITGNTESNENVNIIIKKDGKRYFLDTIDADSEGEYTFNTVLPENMDFEGDITSNGETVDFQINTKKDEDEDETGDEDEDEEPPVEPTKEYVKLSVDLNTIDRGYIIRPTKVQLEKGDTVWDVLKRELDERDISYEYSYSKKYGSVYVESIDGEGEFDHGSNSGWMYEVNGDYPDYGASKYRLEDGDVIKWRYTTDLGEDLGAGLSRGDEKEEAEEIDIEKGDNPVIDIPDDDKDYIIKFDKKHRDAKKIEVNIPNTKSVVTLDFDKIKNKMPKMEIKKKDWYLYIPKGTSIEDGKEEIEVFTLVNKSSEKLKTKVKSILNNGEELVKINIAFKMGNSHSVIFSKPVTIRLKDCKGSLVAFEEDDKIYDIKIYDDDKSGQIENSSKSKYEYAYYDDEDLVIKTNHFTDYILYTTEKKDLQYIDKAQISTWAVEAIRKADALGLIKGDSNNKIKPKENITRAEFIAIIVRMLNIDVDEIKHIHFNDVSLDDWFYPYINAAYRENIVKGKGNIFNPNNYITKEEMAVIISRALKLKKSNINTSIKDISLASHWAKVDISTVFDNKIIVGYNNKFNPKDRTTREMAVVVCVRALDLKDELLKNNILEDDM